MKWRAIRRPDGTFDFGKGDEVVRFAQALGMNVRSHCLVWDHDNPDRLAHAHFSPEQPSTLLQDHIATVVKPHAGQLFAGDVVNETLDEHGKPKDSPWYN